MRADDDERPEQDRRKRLSGEEQYNLVTDLATGVNVRWRDNLIQAIVVAVSALIGTVLGSLLNSESALSGALLGLLIGLIAGVLISGLGIMIYRAVRHAQGKHD